MATLTGDTRGTVGTNSLHAANSMYQAVHPAASYDNNQESSIQNMDQNQSSLKQDGNVEVNNGLVRHQVGTESNSATDNCQSEPDSTTEIQAVAQEQAPTINIVINNVVCTFATRCHLNLKKIATEGANVIYRRENGVYS